MHERGGACMLVACLAQAGAVCAEYGSTIDVGCLVGTTNQLAAFCCSLHLASLPLLAECLWYVYVSCLPATAWVQSKPLYNGFKELKEGPEWARLSPSQKRVVELELRDFVLGGVALEVRGNRGWWSWS